MPLLFVLFIEINKRGLLVSRQVFRVLVTVFEPGVVELGQIGRPIGLKVHFDAREAGHA